MNRKNMKNPKRYVLIVYLAFSTLMMRGACHESYHELDSIRVNSRYMIVMDSIIGEEVRGLLPCYEDELMICVSCKKTNKGVVSSHIEGYTFWSVSDEKYCCRYNGVCYVFREGLPKHLFHKTKDKIKIPKSDELISGEPEIVCNFDYNYKDGTLISVSQESLTFVYNVVDGMPTPADGWENLNKELYHFGLQLSEEEVLDKGRIVIGFIVEPDGNLSAIHIVQSDCEQANDKALEFIHHLPKWHPGKTCNLPRRVRMALSVPFSERVSNDK